MNHSLIKYLLIIITISFGTLNTSGQVYFEVGVPQIRRAKPNKWYMGYGMYFKAGYKWNRIMITNTYYRGPKLYKDYSENGGAVDIAYIQPLNKAKSWNLNPALGYMYLYTKNPFSMHEALVSKMLYLNISTYYQIRNNVHVSCAFAFGYGYQKNLNPTQKRVGIVAFAPYRYSLGIGFGLIKEKNQE